MAELLLYAQTRRQSEVQTAEAAAEAAPKPVLPVEKMLSKKVGSVLGSTHVLHLHTACVKCLPVCRAAAMCAMHATLSMGVGM